jgi:hypothetical protein
MRESQRTTTTEATAETPIIAGRVFTLKLDRKRASRVALPATCCATIAADATTATVAPAGR